MGGANQDEWREHGLSRSFIAPTAAGRSINPVRRNVRYSPRALMSSPRTSLTRVSQELLEQPAQFERRALAAVRHHGRGNVARAIDLPIANRHAAQSWITLRAALTALSPLTSDPALAWARKQLPAGTRAGIWRILKRDKAAAIASDDVQTTILCGLVERAAHGDAIAVAAGGGEADPVGMRRRLPGIALRLERAAVIGDHVALVVDGLWHPQLDQRQLARRSLLTARSCWPRRSPHLRVSLKVRDSLRQNIHDELVLSGDSLPDALVDVVKRDLRRVQLALVRPFLLANVAHYRMPPRYYAYNYNANHGPWSIDVGGQRSTRSATWAVFRRI